MMLSAVMVFLFGSVGPWLKVYSVYYYGVFWGLNGLVQSSGWPTVVAIMGNWFGKSSHGMIFGFWSANASVGNILGALVVSSLLPYGFEYAMMGGSVMLLLGGVVILVCLTEHPNRVGISSPEEDLNPESGTSSQPPAAVTNIQGAGADSEPLLQSESFVTHDDSDSENSTDTSSGIADIRQRKSRKKAVNFFRAFLIPGVMVYSLSYACLKLVNYSLFFWLPFYLSKEYSWANAQESDRLSTLYDVGGIVGGAVGGIISDRLGRRSPVIVVMLISAVAALFVYQGFGGTPLRNGILMCIAGIFIGGPANLESSAIAADLGKQSAVRGDADALATVTGIVDGTGSVGAAIGQTVVAVIQEKTDSWSWVFYFLMVALAGSAMFLVRLFIKDMWLVHNIHVHVPHLFVLVKAPLRV
jgi:OPA family glycerol-3-phosphate transporter-like MFS transporter 3